MWVLLLVEGEDFDILVCKYGKVYFEGFLDEVILLFEYFFVYLSDDLNISILDGCVCFVSLVKFFIE